jgi:hypothetical protein
VNEVEVTVNNLLKKLNDDGLLLKNQYPDTSDLKIFERHIITTKMLVLLLRTRGTPENKEKFSNAMKNFGFDKEHVNLLPWIVELQLLLGSYELLKRTLIQVIDLENIPNLKPKSTLGDIIGKLNHRLKQNFFKNFIDNELRNALGHDDWWIENELTFCYKTKNSEPKKLTLEKFSEIVKNHEKFSKSFYENYGNQYCN